MLIMKYRGCLLEIITKKEWFWYLFEKSDFSIRKRFIEKSDFSMKKEFFWRKVEAILCYCFHVENHFFIKKSDFGNKENVFF